MKSIISFVRGIKINSISDWILAFLGILLVRFFLENISSETATGILASDMSTNVHYILFYIAVAAVFFILLSKLIPQEKRLIPKLILFGFLGIWMAPIFDMVISGGSGYPMAYIFQEPAELIRSFFTFFGPMTMPGATPGVRLEIIILMITIFLLMITLTDSLKKSFIASLGLYAIIFFFGSLPSIVYFIAHISGSNLAEGQSILEWFVASVDHSILADNFLHQSTHISSSARHLEIYFNAGISQIYWLILTPILFIIGIIIDREQMLALIKNIRPERVLHYWMLIGLGLILAYFYSPGSLNSLTFFNVSSILILFLCFALAWLHAVNINDLQDIEVDKKTNAHRPIITGTLSSEFSKSVNIVLVIWILIGGYIVSHHALYMLIAFLALSYVYSCPPLQLRRIPILSTFLIGLASLSAAMAGFFTLSAQKTMNAFPVTWLIFIVIAFTIAANVKDIKDVEGDNAAGYKTLPVMLGKKKASMLIGCGIALVIMSIPIIASQSIIWISSIIFAPAAVFVVSRERFKDRHIFILYFVYTFISLLLLLVL